MQLLRTAFVFLLRRETCSHVCFCGRCDAGMITSSAMMLVDMIKKSEDILKKNIDVIKTWLYTEKHIAVRSKYHGI